MPRVTVATVNYNYGAYLPECIAAVKKQTYKDFEHLVVDCGSNDGSYAIALEAGCRVVRAPKCGIATGRNIAIENARGEYVVNVDSDDVPMPSLLERLVEHAAEKVIVAPGLEVFDQMGFAWNVLPNPESVGLSDFLEKNRIAAPSMFYREDLIAIGGYDTNLDYVGAEDWDCWIRLVQSGCRVHCIPEPLMRYRLHPASMSQQDRASGNDRVHTEYIQNKFRVPVV